MSTKKTQSRERGRPQGRKRVRIAATIPGELHARVVRHHERASLAAGARVSLSAVVEALLEAGLRATPTPVRKADVGDRD